MNKKECLGYQDKNGGGGGGGSIGSKQAMKE